MPHLRSIMSRQYKYFMTSCYCRVSRLDSSLEGMCYKHLTIHLPLLSHSWNSLYFLVLDPALRLERQRNHFHEVLASNCLFSNTSYYSGPRSGPPHCCSQIISHLLFETHPIWLGRSSSNFPANGRHWPLAMVLFSPSSPAIILSYFRTHSFNCHNQRLLVPHLLLTSVSTPLLSIRP